MLVQDGSEVDNISGSPFHYKEFHTGRIHFKDNASLPFKLRYDMVREEMQVLLDSESYKILKDEVPVEILAEYFLKLSYKGQNHESLLGYFKVLEGKHESNQLMLLEKPFKEIKTDQRLAARGIPPKYVDRSDYYLKFKTATNPVLVQRKTEDFLMFFPLEHRQSIEEYVDKENLKPKKEDDLRAIVNYYNSLSVEPSE